MAVNYIVWVDTGALKSKQWGLELPLVISGVIWGSSFVTSKIGVEHIDPVLFSTLRYGFATLSLIPILLLFKHFDRKVFTNKYIIAVSILNALAMAMQNYAMTLTTATNAVLLININIVFIALMAVFILKEKLTQRILVGLGLGMFGAFIISTNGDLTSLGGGNFFGNAMALGAGILWAVYVVYLTKALQSGTEEVSATMVTIFYSTLTLIPLTILVQPDYSMDMIGLEMAVYAGIMCTTVAFILYNYGLRALGATTTSIILLVEMVFGMFFAITLLGETPSLATGVGAGFILFAVGVLSFKKKKKADLMSAVQE